MAGFDFSSPSVLHLGAVTRTAAMALGLALSAMVAPAQAASAPQAAPLIQLAAPQTADEIREQINREMDEFRDDAAAARLARGGRTESADARRTARMDAETARAADARESFKTAVQTAAAKAGTGSCFGGFLTDAGLSADVDASTVLIVAKNTDGQPMTTASGFIARDSGGAGNSHNRVVTARHVVNTDDFDNLADALAGLRAAGLEAKNGESARDIIWNKLSQLSPTFSHTDFDRTVAEIMVDPAVEDHSKDRRLRKALGISEFSHFDVYASNGQLLGQMSVAAMGGPASGKTVIEATDKKATYTPYDWGVLQLDEKASLPESVRRFDRIPGLKLAPVMSPLTTIGMSGDSKLPSASPGFSGGPIVDDSGTVHAVSSAIIIKRDNNVINVGGLASPLAMSNRGGDISLSRGSTDLLINQALIANPLGDPRLLAALGNAGRGVTTSFHASLYSGRVHLTPVGMPMGYCAISTTVQGPIELPLLNSRPAPQGAPGPYETRTTRNGTSLSYDRDGLIASAKLPDGTTRTYERGTLIEEARPDGTKMEYESGKPSLLRRADGTTVAYENGKPVFTTDPDGNETAVAAAPASGHRRR